MPGLRRILACAFCSLLLAPWAPAQQSREDLEQRVERLERELAEVRALLEAQLKKDAAPEAVGVVPVVGPDAAGAPAVAMDEVEEGVTLDFYGYIKVDSSWDSSRVSVGNFARWAEPGGLNDGDSQFTMTANETRLGLWLNFPESGGMTTRGRVEIDFYGIAGTENQPKPVLRQAYMELGWPDSDFSFLAGLTWDVVSPLVAPTVNFTVAWWQGNIGFRRPQIRLTKVFHLDDLTKLQLQGAATRDITGRSTDFTVVGDTGQDAGLPSFQARVGLTFPLFEGGPATVGFSGHYGKEERDLGFGFSQDFNSWSGNVDVVIPITAWLVVKGEAFVGSNLDAFLGGIGQGFDLALNTEIASRGAWGAFTLTHWDGWSFSGGLGAENPNNSDLSRPAARTYNRLVFVNTFYAISDHVSVAFEVSHLYTKYLQLRTGKSWRGQLAFILYF